MFVYVILLVEREQRKPKPLDNMQEFPEADVGLLNSENASYICQLQTKPNMESLKVEGLLMTWEN